MNAFISHGVKNMLNKHKEVSQLSQLCHELRIPLTGIFGAIAFLKQTTLTKEQKSYLAILELSSTRLKHLETTLKKIITDSTSYLLV